MADLETVGNSSIVADNQQKNANVNGRPNANGREAANGSTSYKQVDRRAVNRAASRSVQYQPEYEQGTGRYFTLFMASVADDIIPWGQNPKLRDRQLREFWPTEPFLAGAIFTIVATRANLSWKIDGPPRTVKRIQDMLQASNLGKGWMDLLTKVGIDVLTQDNGAFVEIIRAANSPNAPVLGLNHLDAGLCRRTGVREWPVIYSSTDGREYKMPAHSILTFEDMGSPIESMNGMQYSFVTRVLRSAQIIRDIGIYKREKVGGRDPNVIHLVSGVPTQMIEDKLADEHERADNRGQARYMEAVVLGSLDPNATVSTATLNLKNLPDGFDEDSLLKWYITSIALGAGGDYQDFAPLPSGNLGTAGQSEVLARKSREKGHETWRKMWEHKLNFYVLPQNVTFEFDEPDTAADLEKVELEKATAEKYNIYYDKGMGILPKEVIWQMMNDDGTLDPKYLAMLGAVDEDQDIVATDDEQVQNEDLVITPEMLINDIIRQNTTPTNGQGTAVSPQTAVSTQQASLSKKKDYSQFEFVAVQNKQLDETVQDYQEQIRDLMRQSASGEVSQDDFRNRMQQLVGAMFLAAFMLGGNKGLDQITNEDQVIINSEVRANFDAIPGLYDTAVEWGDNPDLTGEEIDGRTNSRSSLWATAALGMFTWGLLRGGDDEEQLTWLLGVLKPTIDHCSTCLDYSGQTKTRKEWQELAAMGIRPQGRGLSCGGWECGCGLVPA